MSDLEKLENFYNFLKESKLKNIKDISKNYLYFTHLGKTYFDQFYKFSYFNFIIKDETKESKAKFNLAIDFKSMLKYYEYQSYFMGASVLYLMLLISPRKNIFGFNSIFSYITAFGVTFMYQYYHSSRIFAAMDKIYFKDVEYLYKKMKKEDGGFTPMMFKKFQDAEESVKNAEKMKYEKNSVQYKKEYFEKNYSIDEKEKIVDLVKFYSEWLYGPVDEELENKLYFLPESKEEYFSVSLKNKFDELSIKEKTKNLYGIKIIS